MLFYESVAALRCPGAVIVVELDYGLGEGIHVFVLGLESCVTVFPVDRGTDRNTALRGIVEVPRKMLPDGFFLDSGQGLEFVLRTVGLFGLIESLPETYEGVVVLVFDLRIAYHCG